MKSFLKSPLFRVLISASALGAMLFLMRDKIHEASGILHKEVLWSWIGVGTATYFVAILFMAFRLQIVCRVQAVVMNFAEASYLSFVGLFFNLFFPSAIGGDIAKTYYIYKHSGKKLESMTSVIMDRMMGVVSMALMALAAVWLFSRQIEDPRINVMVCVFMAAMLLGLFFIFNKAFARRFKFLIAWLPSTNLKARLVDFYHAFHGYKNHKAAFAASVALSVIGQSLFIWVYYLVALSLNVPISPAVFFMLVPMVSVLSMMPSIGGLGVREAGVVYFFKAHMPSERALALSLLLDMLIYGYSFAGGLLYAAAGGLKKKGDLREGIPT